MPTVRPVRRTGHSRQIGTPKRYILKEQTFAATTAILIRFINTTLENMTEKQALSIHGLAFGGQYEIAIRAAIAIGPDAVSFAVDRVMVAYFVDGLVSVNPKANSFDDPKWRGPFRECVWWNRKHVREQIAVKIQEWGLGSYASTDPDFDSQHKLFKYWR